MQSEAVSTAPAKSNAELKRERREKQEAQRAAKLAAKNAKSAGGGVGGGGAPSNKKRDIIKPSPSPAKPQQPKTPVKGDKKRTVSASQKETSSTGEEVKPPLQAPTPSTARTEKTTGQQALGVMRMDDPAHFKKSIRQLHKKHLQPRPQEPVRVNLFSHLIQPDKRVNVLGQMKLGQKCAIHPAFLKMGIDVDEVRISGSSRRCIEFLRAVSALVVSFQWSPQTACNSTKNHTTNKAAGTSLARTFHTVLDRHVTFLDQCRPLPVTIRNVVQFLKQVLVRLESITSPDEIRKQLLEAIDNFAHERIHLATKAIADIAAQSIQPGEVVCTFGHSSLVAEVLISAWNDTKRFSVLVVDSRPRCDGRRMFLQLRRAGIPCELTHIAALPMFAPKVSLTLMGAHSLLSNGYVISGIGTAQVANIITKVAHTPVLVCAETYKFWERAQSDAFEFNELGDPDEIWRGLRGDRDDWRQHADLADAEMSATNLENWRNQGNSPPTATNTAADGSTTTTKPVAPNSGGGNNLVLLNLAYDVVPPELVSAVVTELGTIPTTSVPVVLRVKQSSIDEAECFFTSLSIA